MGRNIEPTNELLTQIKKLEARIKNLESSQRIGSTAIDEGSLTVVNGNIIIKNGSFFVKNENDETRIFFGPVVYGDSWPDGRGWLYYRDNGGIVFSLEGQNPSDQFFAFRDEVGNIIISDDAATGQGLALPYIPGHFASWAGAIIDSTTSGTFVTLQKSIWKKQHPKFYSWVVAIVGSTTAEIQFKIANGPDSGTIISGPHILNNGAGYAPYGPVEIPGAHLSEFEIDLEGRIASGAGTLEVRVLSAMGVQS